MADCDLCRKNYHPDSISSFMLCGNCIPSYIIPFKDSQIHLIIEALNSLKNEHNLIKIDQIIEYIIKMARRDFS